MSRGLGRLQWCLMDAIESHGKPMTFADIRIQAKKDLGAEWWVTHPSFERSLRRALQTLVRSEMLITLGKGRPGNHFAISTTPS